MTIHWDTIILALIDKAPSILTAIGAIVAAIASVVNTVISRSTHQAVNGQTAKLVEINRKEAGAQATLDEKSAEEGRKGAAAITKADQAG